MKLFISPSEKSEKIVNASDLAARMVLRWPQAVISSIIDTNREFILEWEIFIGDQYLSGKLDRTEDMLVFEFSDLEFGADFAIWAYQNLLTIDNIILYNDDYSEVLALSITSNTIDVIKKFS